MHLVWALLLWAHGSELAITATHVVTQLIPTWQARSVVYAAVALLPLISLRWPGSVAGLVSTLPQLLLLMTSGVSALVAISTGQYADGVQRDRTFIAADQSIYLVLAVLYAIESIDRFHTRRPEDQP